MRKTFFFLLAFFSILSVYAQVKVQRSAIIGNWACTNVSYGDYYSFNLTTNEFKPGENLQKLINDDPERLGSQFINTLKTKLISQLNSYSLTFSDGGSYRFTFKESGAGTYEILKPFILDKDSKTPEGDVSMYMRYGSGKITRISLSDRNSNNPEEVDYYVDEKAIEISEFVSGGKGQDIFVSYTFTRKK